MLQRPDPTLGTIVALDGDLPGAEFIRSIRDQYRAIIAADGAALRLLDKGIVPDVVIGDLDGLGDRRMELFTAGSLVIELESQEKNDFEKALQWAIDRGETDITLIGLSGGMPDHALNNFSVTGKFARRLKLTMIDEHSVAHVVTSGLTLKTTPGNRISLIPLPSARLTTTGLRWELHNEILEIGVREGASNMASGEEMTVVVHEGVVVVFWYAGSKETKYPRIQESK